jgi:hypothetical protein
MYRVLEVLDAADRRGTVMARADREALELVAASRYRMAASARRLPREADATRRARLEDLVRRYPTDEGVQAALARPAVKALLFVRPSPALPSLLFAAMLFYDALVKVALGALAMAVLARGALLRLLGFEIVTRDGAPASRLRVTARTAVAWAAVLVPAAAFAATGDWYTNVATNITIAYAAILVQSAGAAFAIVHPARGIQDRLAGTWIVPR